MTIKADTLTGAHWFKSSYSNNSGGNCVEAARLTGTEQWFTTSYSNDHGGECVEGARLAEGGGMAVRDSKNPGGPALLFTPTEWTAFTRAIRDGELPAV